jgi:hypothetical protein
MDGDTLAQCVSEGRPSRFQVGELTPLVPSGRCHAGREKPGAFGRRPRCFFAPLWPSRRPGGGFGKSLEPLSFKSFGGLQVRCRPSSSPALRSARRTISLDEYLSYGISWRSELVRIRLERGPVACYSKFTLMFKGVYTRLNIRRNRHPKLLATAGGGRFLPTTEPAAGTLAIRPVAPQPAAFSSRKQRPIWRTACRSRCSFSTRARRK